MSETSFPQQQARTRRFSLGAPRNFVIAADGSRVAFLRSRTGDDQSTCLWLLDVAGGAERLVVNPEALLSDDGGEVPPEERARRERARESSGGIVRFSAEPTLQRAAFDLAGRLYVVDLETDGVTELTTGGVAIDPQMDPTGTSVAYVERGALHVIRIDGTGERTLATPEHDDITYGSAEFVAAEEMGRQKGYWWSPDGSRLLVARVDVSRVVRWHIADPANPERVPVDVAYPQAGTDNAAVALHVIALDGASTPVRWDAGAFEYVTTCDWSEHGLLVVVQSRDQRTMRILAVNPDTGETSVLREDHDDAWVDIVHGVPTHLPDGTLVWTADHDGAKRLIVGADAVTAPPLEVRDVMDVDGDVVVFSASVERTEIGVYTWSRAAGVQAAFPDLISGRVARARRAGGTTVLMRRGLDFAGIRVSVHRDDREVAEITSLAETPSVSLNIRLVTVGDRELRAAVLFPHGHTPGSGQLPVLLDPYGGPGHQKVIAASSTYLESQWFADQGFAVLVVDGRGTPGGGPAWERSIRGDVATPVLEDQVDALNAAATMFPDFDVSRVAIRGWSYGGYLAALAVLRRPDVFHVAVAGAPVSDDALYDTHYTERYLGRPDEEPANYEQVSLLNEAANLRRPLMLIHGLSDDNVVVAHTLRLSAALLAAGRMHTVLPLTGATHMANDPVIAENLLLLELEFIRRELGIPTGRE
jgi:dipeptidyl-peptidase 4